VPAHHDGQIVCWGGNNLSGELGGPPVTESGHWYMRGTPQPVDPPAGAPAN
jgi:hypothetical protein